MSTIHTIVAGVSRLTRDDPALNAAAERAREGGAAVHLVHACEVPHLHTLPHPGAPGNVLAVPPKPAGARTTAPGAAGPARWLAGFREHAAARAQG